MILTSINATNEANLNLSRKTECRCRGVAQDVGNVKGNKNKGFLPIIRLEPYTMLVCALWKYVKGNLIPMNLSIFLSTMS